MSAGSIAVDDAAGDDVDLDDVDFDDADLDDVVLDHTGLSSQAIPSTGTSPLSLHTRKQTLHQLGRSPAPALSPPEYPGGSLIESEICRQSSQPTLVGQSCSTDR